MRGQIGTQHFVLSKEVVLFNTLDAMRHLSGVRTYSHYTPRAT